MGRTMANLERTISTAAMALNDLEWPAAPLNRPLPTPLPVS